MKDNSTFFTIESLEDNNTITFTKESNAPSNTFYYSKNNSSTWTSSSSTTSWILNKGETIRFRSSADRWHEYTNSTHYGWVFSSTGEYDVYGNIMSLLYATNVQTSNFSSQKNLNKSTTLSNYYNTFYGLFKNSTHLKHAHELILPATTLSGSCYREMFYGCTSLVSAPELPATDLSKASYDSSTYDNTSVYNSMFYGCVSLAKAPKLPATTLCNYCYMYMFENCSSLVDTYELPATTLVQYCYQCMFYGCTALMHAPKLPATTLADSCYSYMFYGCTSLEQAPDLIAPTLVAHCYYSMFNGCSKIDKVVCLATDISASNCTNGWLSNVSQTGIFYKDKTMSSWTSDSSGIPSGWTTKDYVVDRIATYVDDIRHMDEMRKMYKGLELADRMYMNDKLVRGVEKFKDYHDYSQDYFSMEFYEDGQVKIGMGKNGISSSTGEIASANIYYSINGGEWGTLNVAGGQAGYINASKGDIVRLKSTSFWSRGYDKTYDKETFSYIRGTSRWRAFGNVESLFWGDDFYAHNGTPRELHGLFREADTIFIYVDYPNPDDTPEEWTDGNVHGLVDAKDLVFTLCEQEFNKTGYVGTGLNKVTSYTYDTYPGYYMFANCEMLEVAPDQKNVHMPTKLAGCLKGMFFRCLRLKACDWIIEGYRFDCECMFWFCISMVRGPKMLRGWTEINSVPVMKSVTSTYIHSGSLVNRTYMFGCCIRMVSAPVLIGTFEDSTTSTDNMFFRCYRLKFIRMYHCYWKNISGVWELYDTQYIKADPFGLTSTSDAGYKYYGSNILTVHSNIYPSSWSTWNNTTRRIKVINDLTMDQIIERYLQ